jgi:hypothetical protein
VEYADDGVISLVARSPKVMIEHVKFAASKLDQVLSKYGMVVNWKAGKTEAIATFRGNGAVAARALCVVEEEKGVYVDTRAGAKFMRFVGMYKYLGSYVTASGSLIADAKHRASMALAVYGPLALKVYGAASSGWRWRLKMAKSLVFSKLLYNVHIWSSFEGRHRDIINAVYMRVLRRILGDHRAKKPLLSDLAVRVALQVFSIDSLVRVRRLKYLSRMASSGALFLNSALDARNKFCGRLPWIQLLCSDLIDLRMKCNKLDQLPDPTLDLGPYIALAKSYPSEWGGICDLCLTPEDDQGFSRGSKRKNVGVEAEISFVCDI